MDVLRTQVPPVVTPAGGRESPMLLGRVIRVARRRGRAWGWDREKGRQRERRNAGREKSEKRNYEIGGFSASTREGDTESRTTNATRTRPRSDKDGDRHANRDRKTRRTISCAMEVERNSSAGIIMYKEVTRE